MLHNVERSLLHTEDCHVVANHVSIQPKKHKKRTLHSHCLLIGKQSIKRCASLPLDLFYVASGKVHIIFRLMASNLIAMASNLIANCIQRII